MSRKSIVDSILVPHSAFQAGLKRLEQGVNSIGAGDPYGIGLFGESRSGKTSLLNHVRSCYPQVRNEHALFTPVLMIKTPAIPTIKSLALELLAGLGEFASNSQATESTLRRRIILQLHAQKTRVIMLDEFQHFVERYDHHVVRSAADWLKNLVEESGIMLVVAGLPIASSVVSGNEQMVGRFSRPIFLKRFDWSETNSRQEFIGVLNAFQVAMSKHFDMPELTSKDLAYKFYFASGGLTGYIAKILRQVTWDLADVNRDVITIQDLEAAFAVAMWSNTDNFFNPFSDDFNPKEHSVDDAKKVGAPVLPEPPKQTRGRKKSPNALGGYSMPNKFPPITPLPITPRPQQDESYRGYILRLSESNGLGTPATMLRYAGLHEDEIRLSTHPPEVIAALVDCPESTIREIYPGIKNRSSRTYLAGRIVRGNHLQTKISKICPECVLGLGYQPALWDLQAMIVCPTHRTHLITRCPECDSKLSWMRPGLLECRCGTSLGNLRGEEAPNDLIDMAKMIHAAFYAKMLNDSESLTRMPFSGMSFMSLDTMLRVISSVGARWIWLQAWEGTRKNPDGVAKLKAASQVFSNWPHNFHALLEMESQVMGDGKFSFWKSQQSTFEYLFKRNYAAHEVAFLGVALMEFASKHAARLSIDSRLILKHGDGIEDQHSIKSVCKRLRITPATLRRRIRVGIYDAEVRRIGRTAKIFFNTEPTAGILPNDEGSLSIREAAEYIGLPVSVLCNLREAAIYKPMHHTDKLAGWAKQDLDACKTLFLSKSVSTDLANHDDLVDIATIMRMKPRHEYAKSEVLMAIHRGDIRCFGEAGSIHELLISKTEAKKILAKSTMKELG